jgi:hypothetical protein
MTWMIFWIKYGFHLKEHRLREFVEFLGDDKIVEAQRVFSEEYDDL